MEQLGANVMCKKKREEETQLLGQGHVGSLVDNSVFHAVSQHDPGVFLLQANTVWITWPLPSNARTNQVAYTRKGEMEETCLHLTASTWKYHKFSLPQMNHGPQSDCQRYLVRLNSLWHIKVLSKTTSLNQKVFNYASKSWPVILIGNFFKTLMKYTK